MKGFYSIIYLVANKASNEKVSIGLLAGSEERPFLEYSDRKLKKALSLVDSNLSSNINNLLNNYKKKVESFNSRTGDTVLIKTKNKDWPFNFSRVNYLSRSADGIIEFSKPKYPSERLNEARFVNLFRLLVDEKYLTETNKDKKEKDRFKRSIKRFKNSDVVRERADINLYLSNDTFHTIYYNEVKIDLLSCNGGILSGNAIDFTMGEETIQKHLHLFRALSEGINSFSREKKLREEPKNILFFNKITDESKERILNSVYNDKEKPFELLEVDELGKVEEELENRDYHKFSEKFPFDK